ncbi:MAG: hypothetical protein Q7R95_10415 [bacterium]|nr:hypothetical protein [bacterium]
MDINYLRSFRIFKYAIFDLTVSFLGIFLLSPLLTKLFLKININIPTSSWLYLTLPISILTHIIINNHTKMTQNFLDINGHYLLKIFILSILFLGLKGIKFLK